MKFLVIVTGINVTTYHPTLNSALDLVQNRLYDNHSCLMIDLESKTTYFYEDSDSTVYVDTITDGEDSFEEDEE